MTRKGLARELPHQVGHTHLQFLREINEGAHLLGAGGSDVGKRALLGIQSGSLSPRRLRLSVAARLQSMANIGRRLLERAATRTETTFGVCP
jgi:hypothetical protein